MDARTTSEPAYSGDRPEGTGERRVLTRPWRIVRNVVIGIIAVIFLAWLVLYITKGRFLKHPFERITASSTHRQVKVAGDFQLYFDPFDIKFLAEGMTMSNPAWASRPNLFEGKRIETRIAPLPLLFGQRRFRWLDLIDGAVDLEWDKAHQHNTWTFSEQKGGKPFQFPVIGRATVAGTTLRYVDPTMRLSVDVGFETIKSTGSRIKDAVHFAGRGVVRDTPFTLSGALLSPNATVARGKNELTMAADAAHNHITLAGTLPSVADVENVPLAVTARGRNANELLGIIGVAVPQTRGYTLHARMVKSNDTYSFTRMAGRFGDSDISGRFTVRNIRPRIYLTATLATRSLDIVDAAPFIGFNPDIVAAKGVAAAAAGTGAAPARLLPDANLRVESLRNFDADAHWHVGVVRSRNVPISNVELTVTLKDRLLKLSPLTFVMARGHVSSDIVMDERRAPIHTDYDIRLAPTPMGRLLAGWGVDEAGTSGTVRGHIKLTGDGDTLHDSLSASHGRIAFIIPQGSFWTRNVQLSELDVGTFVQKMFEHRLKEPVHINCGLIGFTVRGGTAAADPILIDTQKNVIVGRGGFSFKTEAMDMAFRADGKRFSIFSGQSPIALNGYFSKPAINVISPELVGRAGLGLGLALVATPLAAIIPFVDIGDAKGAQCGPVLAGATASAQRTTKGAPRDDVGHGTTSKNEDGKKRKKFLGIF